MKWYVVLILIVAMLLLFIGEPVLAQMDGRQQMGDRGKASQMMEYGKTTRAQQGMHGLGFMHSAGNAYGEYVTFAIDTQTGAILNYGIMGTTLFNLSIANFVYKSNSTRGSVTWITSADGSTRVQVHDNPAAVINILTNKSIAITFTLADGVNATKEDNMVKIESRGIVGYIAGTPIITSTVSPTQVIIDVSPNSAVIFRAVPVNMPDHIYRRFSQEVANKRVGMEIALDRDGTYNAINYSTGIQLGDMEMLQDRIRLHFNATDQAGPIIAINLDNTSLRIKEGERLRIHYDGVPMDCVNDPNMVFNGTDRPLCWISPIQDNVRAQVMIHIPHYSEHTIDILVEPEGTTVSPTANATITTAMPVKTPGFDLMLSLGGLLTMALLFRRRGTGA
jgi:hypothetical protein